MQTAARLTIFIACDEKRAHRPLKDVVLELLQVAGVAGATVTKGVMGYGQSRHIHSDMNEIMMENLPLIIEVVDDQERLEEVALRIAETLGEHGLVHLQRTSIYTPARPPQ